jgi:hypothetical protein
MALGAVTPDAASACPVCDTATGALVRAGIFDDTFWVTLLQVTAPLPVLVALIARLHFGKGNER